jgi:predicted nucleic acid-binding protein
MLIVDTSVVVKWVVPENASDIELDTSAALDLLSRHLVAPDCLLGEFANAMFKKVMRSEISIVQAREAITILPDLVSLLPTSLFVAPAFELATHIGHPVHDCVFLMAAIQQNSELVTADKKFVEKCVAADDDYPIHELAEGSWI